MLKMFENLKSIEKRLSERIERREKIFEERSQEWKNTVNGEVYEEKTAELYFSHDRLKDCINYMESAINMGGQ